MKKLTNRIAHYLLAALVIIMISLVFMSVSIYFHQSKHTEVLSFYNKDKIYKYCQLDELNPYLQDCLRKDLTKITASFTPNDTFYILKAIDDTLHFDLKKNNNINSYILYYENIIIFLMAQNNIYINRNDFTFYSLPMIPVASVITQLYVKRISNDLQNNLKNTSNEKDNFRIKRILRFFERIEFKTI